MIQKRTKQGTLPLLETGVGGSGQKKRHNREFPPREFLKVKYPGNDVGETVETFLP